MRRALVTGGAGFLGLHLVERLIHEGWSVVVIDSLLTSKPWRVERLKQLGAMLVVHDVVQPFDVGPVDVIYNLACAASPPAYQRDPVHTLLTCVLGAKNAAAMATKYDATLLHTSTSEVYGDPLEHPQSEDYRGNVAVIGPRACYDEGKRAAETLLSDLARDGLRLRVARIFNTYGPGMSLDDGRVVSNFIRQALSGEPLTVYGLGMQTRSFCYVDDMISGLMMLAESDIDVPVNLGNDDETTVLSLAQTISDMFCRPLDIRHDAMPADDPKVRQPDLTRAIEMLGWHPMTTLERGLEQTIDDFERRMA